MARVLKAAEGSRSATSLLRSRARGACRNLAAYVACIAGAISIDAYCEGLLAAGFSAVEIVDSGADLNAYAAVEGQTGCCSPAMSSEEKPLLPIASSCCGPAKPAGLHADLEASFKGMISMILRQASKSSP